MTEDYARLEERYEELRDMYFDDLKVTHRLIQKLHWRLHALDGVEYDDMLKDLWEKEDD